MKEFIELLKTQSKWESLSPAVRKTTLEQINGIIKKDNRWEWRYGEPRTLSDLLCARCYHDIYYDIFAQIMECDFGVLSVFDSTKIPYEIKSELKAKNIGIIAVRTHSKSYAFLIFARSRSFDLYAFLWALACKYSGRVFAYAKNHKPFLLINAQNNATFKPKKLFISDILDFYTAKIDFKKLAFFSSLPSGCVCFEFGDIERSFCSELSGEIYRANALVFGSIACFTARTLWFDNYDKNSYFKE